MDALRIGIKLAELRGNTPRATVAQEVDISKSALAMYETGNRIPRDEIKKRLANYYGQSVEDIFFT